MSLDCRRWVELADLEAVGEALPADDRAFQRSHEATCAECAREAAIWRALKAPGLDPAPAAEVERIMALAAAKNEGPAARVLPHRSWLRATSGTAVVAAAAALVLWLSTRLEHKDAAKSSVLARATVASAPSAASVPVAPATLMENVGAEPSCSQVVPGATVCLARDTTLAKRTLELPDRALELVRGRAVVALAPQAPGTSFSLTTAIGKVTAVGTIFSVEVRPDGATVARVIEGSVLVRVGDAVALSLRAGQALRMGETEPTPLSDQERDSDLGLLSLSGSIERPFEPSSAPKASDSEVAPAPSADTLERARSLRASGDFRHAADVYRRIHAKNPQSPSGRAALLSLGELLLSLKDAAGALNAFDSYLAVGGPLAQEAMFGRARSLRALGRSAEERRAIERFLAAYPDAPQSRVLRSRLAAMSQ